MEIQYNMMIDKQEFSSIVERFIAEKPMPYIDAVIRCAETYGIEPEAIAKLVNKNIKDKIEYEAEDLNLLKTSAKLPI